MISGMIEQLLQGESLTRQESAALFDQIMRGHVEPVLIAGLLVALRGKGESADEVAGAVDSLRAHVRPIPLHAPHMVDGCGTGGDGSQSFNISTAASLVAAAAGATVAKHGNRSVSSRCGSADLLEAAGVAIDLPDDVLIRQLQEKRFAFFFAPRFHPALMHATPVRKALRLRTIFNLLGPLCNPAAVRRQVIGVYSPAVAQLMADAAVATGSERLLVVHADDGLDEFSVCAPTDVVDYDGRSFHTYRVEPEQFGLTRYRAGALIGGSPAENAAILSRVMSGELGPYRASTILNAGALLAVAGIAKEIGDGVKRAAEAIDSGTAATLLHDLAGTRP